MDENEELTEETVIAIGQEIKAEIEDRSLSDNMILHLIEEITKFNNIINEIEDEKYHIDYSILINFEIAVKKLYAIMKDLKINNLSKGGYDEN